MLKNKAQIARESINPPPPPPAVRDSGFARTIFCSPPPPKWKSCMDPPLRLWYDRIRLEHSAEWIWRIISHYELLFIPCMCSPWHGCGTFYALCARLVCNSPRFSHCTPLLSELHWLPIKQRIFKTLLITYKAIHGKAPVYNFTLRNF